jgi:hypothetical protein
LPYTSKHGAPAAGDLVGVGEAEGDQPLDRFVAGE